VTVFGHIEGHTVIRATVHVPARGVWWADVDLEGDPDVSGRVTLTLGQLELSGTILESQAGTHGLQRRVRLAGGAGGWGTVLRARAYHSDAGVQARTIVEDAAREAGEELGNISPAVERIGPDYVRQAGPASRVLEDAIGGVPWWVDYDGKTQVGPRSSAAAEGSSYEVLEYEPRARLVTLAVDDLRAVGIGTVLSDRLDAQQTVRELELDVADVVRVRAWCGGDGSPFGRLVQTIEGLVARATDRQLFGLWQYRVSRMSGDRVELQAVSQAAGLPDILPISMRPGAAGVHAELAQGAEVLVQFVEGDRAKPVITHFAGKDGVGWTPTSTTVDITTLLKLGAGASQFAAKAQDVLDRLNSIVNGFNAHTHLPGSFVAGSTAVTGASGTPVSPLGAPTSVAASKVKVE
jgi:hypothetical protein